MQQPTNGFSGYLRQLTILHAALVMGVALMGIVMYFVASPADTEGVAPTTSIPSWVASAFAIGGVLASSFFFRLQVQNAKKQSNLADKLAIYRGGAILRYALIEGPALYSFVAYLLEGRFYNLALGGLLMIVLFLYRPSKDRIINDLALNAKEQAELVG